MKLASRPGWSHGLFISYGKFTVPGLDAFHQGHSSIICVDQFELRQPLSQKLPLDSVTACKAVRNLPPAVRSWGRPLIVVALPIDEEADTAANRGASFLTILANVYEDCRTVPRWASLHSPQLLMRIGPSLDKLWEH